MYDVVVVGTGISGAVVARELAEKLNYKVLAVDRRKHIAGNIYDEIDEHGILIQKYGPHIFHTNNEEVWNYVNQFATWNAYSLKCEVFMNNKFTPSPFNFQTIDDYFSKEEANEIKTEIQKEYPSAKFATIVDMLESSNTIVKKYAQFLFDNDYSLYTAKQWGISPSKIDLSVLKRVPVLFSYECNYFNDTYQAMPCHSFTHLIESILSHDNIDVRLETDCKDILSFRDKRIYFENKPIMLIYTGAIDELFNYQYGSLPYRTLEFEYKHFSEFSYQHEAVVAYPQEKDYTRITEFKKLYNQECSGTTIAIEYPKQSSNTSEPYYPIPTDENSKKYQQYYDEALKYENLYLCGRLANYKYYNMDQAFSDALSAAKRIISIQQ